MSTVVRVLEQLARDPAASLRMPLPFPGSLSYAERSALLARDVEALRNLLGARVEMKCLIFSEEDVH